MPIEDYKHLGLLSIAITWLGLLFLIYRWKGNRSLSFSLHAAAHKTSAIYYFVLFAGTLPLFYIFISEWFIPTMGLPKMFLYLSIISIVGQLVAVSIPEVAGWKGKVHRLAAYVVHFFLMILVAFILSVNDLSLSVRLIGYLSLGTMIYLWVRLSMTLKKPSDRLLVYQAAYVACFHLNVLSATYIR